MFDTQGNYSPPDQRTQHALVATEAFTGMLRAASQPPLRVPIAKGTVLAVDNLGATNVAFGQGPRHPKAVLIEHATAKVGDVLPDDEVTPAIAAAAAKQAAVAKYRAEEASKPPAPNSDPPLTAEERKALRALIAAKPPA